MKKRKLLKRGLASLLAAVLAVGMLPMMSGNMATVKAADGYKTIAGLGTDKISNPTEPENATDAWQGSYVYFGTYGGNPVKYRVLDNNTSVFGGTTMLLDCDSILWAGTNGDNQSSAFDDDSNVWANSNIRTYLNGTFLTNNFSAVEQNAIVESTKSTAYSGTDGADGDGCDYSSYAPLSNDKIFFLDAKEATNISYGYSNSNTQSSAANRKKTGGNANWWLRSAVSYYSDYAYVVSLYGNIPFTNVRNNANTGVSPAFNIKLSSVLFTSVILGTAGTTGAEYKLTLLDSDMTIAGNGDVTRSGDTVTVPYTISGGNSANATRVSVLITDKVYTDSNAQILYYGALDKSAGNGTGTFTLSSNLSDKVCGRDYYAYIIAEDVNGEKETDYASTPVSITVPAPKYAVTVTGGSGSGQYAQGETVTITASAAPSGQQFKEWEIVSGNITLASSTSETTSFTMPAEEVNVKAIYEAVHVTESTITATAGANGTISPSGAVKVTAGGSQTFTISPSSGYVIDTLKVDGLEVTAATSYTFSDVNTNHAIEVTFKQESQTPEVTAPSITTQPGNSALHTVTGNATPDPESVGYDILDGANSSWTQNTDGSLSIRGSGAFSKFVGVKVDGTPVDGKNYTVKEGSTIITLKTDYLNTLSVGTHTFEILWTDGSASTTFALKADTSEDGNQKDDAPKTGDDTPIAWMFMLSILSGTGLIITAKKRRVNLDSSKR